MAFVNERLYNGYLRRNMATIVSRVKPIEIMMHLACLTDHDREEIKVKTETRGKFDGMVCLLDCLKRREQWLEQLIEALEACEYRTIAAEIRAEYNALMGLDNSSASLPPSVVRAHVDLALSASPLQLSMDAAVSRPAKAPEAVQARPSISPPQPIPQLVWAAPTEVLLSPSTPPLPETPLRQEITDPPLQTVAISPFHSEENSESNSDQSMMIPQMHHPEDKDPKQYMSSSPSALYVNSEKLPVQDTTPPLTKVTTEVQQPEHTSEPSTKQVVGTRPASFLESDEPGFCRRLQDDSSVWLSKPYQLISIQSFNQSCPTLLAASILNQPSSQFLLPQPYSGRSDRLEISHYTPAECALICQENRSSQSHSEPEENHYNSSSSSFSIQLGYENVDQVLEEPSILNPKVQLTTSHTKINGEFAKEVALKPKLSSADTQSHRSSESCDTAERADAEKLRSPTPPTWFTKNILTVAGVGVCALLVVLKFKN